VLKGNNPRFPWEPSTTMPLCVNLM
jgi:hypothetical protein